jgi:hypothetical protein
METDAPLRPIKASPSHERIAVLLAEQVKMEYAEFLMRERAGTLTPRPTETCCHCRNDFVKSEMVFIEARQMWSGFEVKGHHYCTEECQAKGELVIMRKAEADDEKRRLFKFRNTPVRWLTAKLTSMVLNK